jgi:hypothetical protein
MAAPEFYEIRVKGRLGPEWSVWFEGVTVTARPGGETMLTGSVVDQAALHGLLVKIRNLGLPLLSLNRIEAGGREGDSGGALGREERRTRDV